MTKNHYVYRSFEKGGREYIGIRSCNCLPEDDTKYFGSFEDKSFKPTVKTILFVCETRIEALEIEVELHDFFDVAVNPQFANQAKQTSTKFDRTGVSNAGEKHPRFGVPWTEEQKRKLSEAMTGELNPMFGKKRPDFSEILKKQTGELHPMFGRTGELHPVFGKKNPAVSERNRKLTGELNHNYGKKWWVNSEGKTYMGVEAPGPDWQNGRNWRFTP